MRVYYLVLLGLINIYGIPQVAKRIEGRSWMPLPMLSWAEDFNLIFLSASIIFGLVIVCLLAACFPQKRLFRSAVFIWLFLFNGFNSSFGGVTHLYQFWLWSSAAFAIMPNYSVEFPRKDQLTLLTGWRFAQIIVLSFYGMSGFWKFYGMVEQIFRGETHLLSPDGLAYHIGSEVIRAGAEPLLAQWIFENRSFSFVFAAPVLMIQLACWVFIFNRRWDVWVGIALIIFHLGTFLFLEITYPTNFFLVAIMFLNSPFAEVKPWAKIST